jgi:NodT family efflux transporter outer membrane factor (OMF) lipoprotein
MFTSSRFLALLLSVSLLTGCALGPNYRPPETPLSARFLGADGVERREAQSEADLKAWWAAFDDPALTRFVSLALAQNLDIAQAAARVAQSRASLRQAGAALLPSGDVSAHAAKVYQSLETPLGQVLAATPDFDRTGSSYEANVGASWEIDVFGGLRRGREAARAEYAASEAGAVATRLAVTAQTADVYVTIRGLQARIAIARQQAQTRRQLLSLVTLQYERGIAAELQVNQAEGALAQVEAQIPVLETGLDAAMNALDVLLGAQPGTYRAELSPSMRVPVAPGLAETGTPGEMIRRRPDLIVAERRLAAANARIGVAISEYYPKVLARCAAGQRHHNLERQSLYKRCEPSAGRPRTSLAPVRLWPRRRADRRRAWSGGRSTGGIPAGRVAGDGGCGERILRPRQTRGAGRHPDAR